MKKKALIIFGLFFLLSSCGGDDNVDTSLVLHENEDFSISIPANWEKLDDIEKILPKASLGNIELAASSSSPVGGFSNNILILSTDLNKITTSKDYSMLNNIGAEADYVEYLKLSSKEITFSGGDTSIAYEFEAKYNLESPKLKFIQTAHICNNTKAYLITLALPTSVTDISRYLAFISTFTCK